MSLTSAQIMALREYAGLSVAGNAAFYGAREMAYSNVGLSSLSFETRLANLSSDEEARLASYYLPNLAAREQDIQDAASNLDVAEAGNVKFNAREISQRRSLFNALRRDLCSYLGFPPGDGLSDVGRLVRG